MERTLSAALTIPTIDALKMHGKTVLVRTDLNVPMEGGRVTDDTRIVRLLPTLTELAHKGAKVVILSHFGRPQGKFVPGMSLAPLVDALSAALSGKEVRFGVDCVGESAQEAIQATGYGEYVLLENLRFHAEEEKGDAAFASALAALGDIYVNDAFSCSHRAHASIAGIAQRLPSAAGRLLEQEVKTLASLFSGQNHPLIAIIGGSKVFTKLELLHNLIKRVDKLIIGGAMANTFLAAQGYGVGCSLQEGDLHDTARAILAEASASHCEILLPVDVVAASALSPQASCIITDIASVPTDRMIVDVGPETVAHYAAHISASHTAVWNGPLGAFEISPFDCGTVSLARLLAGFTRGKGLKTVAGGGDTVSAVTHSGLAEEFTYLSTAGGAFLEWLEGKTLPGIAALLQGGSSPSNAVAV